MAVAKKLVIIGNSNILSDLFDCALAQEIVVSKIVLHEPEDLNMPRSIPLAERLSQWRRWYPDIKVIKFDEFYPDSDEQYILGPTTPLRRQITTQLDARFTLQFCTLIHPRAYVSPLADVAPGVFIGANSVIAPGVRLAAHTFVNRAVSIGHDTVIGEYSRIQPGSNLGGLSQYGTGVTVGLGATVLERTHVGDNSVIAAGSVVLEDVPANVMVAGVPAKIKKQLAS